MHWLSFNRHRTILKSKPATLKPFHRITLVFLNYLILVKSLRTATYVMAISSLAKTNQVAVGRLLVQLSKDAHYEADAPGDLQRVTAAYAAEYTKAFIDLWKRLPAGKQANLITFLADVENHDAYPEYEQIIAKARSLGQTAFAEKLVKARTKRSRQPH